MKIVKETDKKKKPNTFSKFKILKMEIIFTKFFFIIFSLNNLIF